MKRILSYGVASIKFDKNGKFCLIKFFPESKESDDELKKTHFYTIVSVEELKGYGGVPKYCELIPVKELENKDLFNLESHYKPSVLDGISYYGSQQGFFWEFKENRPSLDDLTKKFDEIFPTAKHELRSLIAKHIMK
jgi:hypothetical protein